MVIPVGAFGQPLTGPPPPELRPRFVVIKACVCAMGLAVIFRLVAGLLMNSLSQMITLSFNLILNTVVGIFLLNEDEHLGPIYGFMLTTCCQPCQEQCRGGMSCLMTFVLCNLITVVLDVLLSNTITKILKGVEALFYPQPDSPTDAVSKVAFVLYLMSVIIALVAQAIGCWQGWKAHQQAQQDGHHVVPGESDWGQPSGGGGGWNNWGGGRVGEDRGRPAQAEMQETPAPGAGRASAGFQAFSGQGNRLGE